MVSDLLVDVKIEIEVIVYHPQTPTQNQTNREKA